MQPIYPHYAHEKNGFRMVKSYRYKGLNNSNSKAHGLSPTRST